MWGGGGDNFLTCLYFDIHKGYKVQIGKSWPNWIIKPHMYVRRSTTDGKAAF